MKRTWILLVLLVVTIALNQLPVVAQANKAKSSAGRSEIPGCTSTTYQESLGKACGWAYWEFFFENYISTASRGAKAVGADTITVAPTFYPGFDPTYNGLTFSSPEWTVSKGQVKTLELAVWVNSLPAYNATPLYCLNGFDDDLSTTTNDASVSVHYLVYDGNGNPIAGANALDYINITGSVSEDNTQVFPAGVALPFEVVVHLSLRGNNGTATVDLLRFPVFANPA
jgi:hypothetical protein